MRRSLFARLLTLSLTVAVVAVAATAWLATRTTSERITGEFDRRLEADAFVYTQLLDRAASTADWDGVEPLLEDLARRTGQRIALTSEDGSRLADTAATGQEPRPALPEVPAALIDPFDPLQEVTEDTADATAGAVPLVPDLVLETPHIRAERAALLTEATACLREVGIDLDPAAYVELAADLPDDAQQPLPAGCHPFEAVVSPTAGQVAMATEIRERATACVLDLGASEELVLQLQGLLRASADGRLALHRVQARPQPVPEPTASPLEPPPADQQATPPSDSPTSTLASPAVGECITDAHRAVFGPYVADPALLWIGDPPEEGLLATAGGGRLLGALGAVLAVAVAVTVLAGRRLVAPVHALTDAADRMGAGERSARVEVRGRDDVARLGAAFNRMAASVDQSEQQRRAMVSDIAHELRTPLTTLRGYLEGAQDGVVDVDGGFVDSLHGETVLLQRLVADLQQLAVADAGQLHVRPEPLDAADVVEHVVATHRGRAADLDVDLVASAARPVAIAADPHRLRQALGNLVDNALAYTPAGGRVEVAARIEGDTALLEVADTGAGIAAEDLPHVFDRFYRADPSRSRRTGGSGLGLPITRTLVEAHGGTVAATSTPGRGSTFTIRLDVRDD